MIVIAENNCVTNDPCGLCGERTDPTGAFDLFEVKPDELPQLVCCGCARRETPRLFVLWSDFQRGEGESF